VLGSGWSEVVSGITPLKLFTGPGFGPPDPPGGLVVGVGLLVGVGLPVGVGLGVDVGVGLGVGLVVSGGGVVVSEPMQSSTVTV
jgi:hypothetical protein